jgi:hypothetical protein
MLKKDGLDSEIPTALEKFDGAPVNERIEIVPGLELIEWQTEGIRPDLRSGESVPNTWPLKTAYEFLACYMGGAIYSDAFEPCRQMLRGGDWNDSAVTVERLQADQTRPIHVLRLEENAPYTRVQVRLFRRVCYRVHFKRIAVSGPRMFYEQDLAQALEVRMVLEADEEARPQ